MNEKLTKDLIEAAKQLAATSVLFADVISAAHGDDLRNQAKNVLEIVDKLGGGWSWKGEIKEDELQIETWRAPWQTSAEEAQGVKITHLPTGVSGQSYSKPSQSRNREIALEYVKKVLRTRYSGYSQ